MKTLYWLKQSLINCGTVLLSCTIYTFLMSTNNSPFVWEDVLMDAAVYALLFGGIMFTMLTTNLYSQNIPMVISFGSTRKEVVLGLQIYRAVSILILAIPATVLFSLCSSNSPFAAWLSIPTCIGFFLLCHAAGAVLSILNAKFGKAVFVIAMIVLILVMAGFIIFFIAVMESDFPIGLLAASPWILLAAGAVVYGLVSIPEIRTIRRFNVKM